MKLGACTQQWNFMYIEDLIESLLALAVSEGTVGYTGEAGENGVYNLASDRDATMPLRAYVEEMHRLCGGRGGRIYGEMPPNAGGQANLIPDIEKIKKRTGWRPKVSFEEAVELVVQMAGCGVSLSDAAKSVAADAGYKKGELYRAAIEKAGR